MDEVPVGLCQCGCERPTAPAAHTRAAHGIQAGEPNRWVRRGHHPNTRAYRPLPKYARR
jgi:hypothetical protein